LLVDEKYLTVEKQLRPFRDPGKGNYLNLTLQNEDGRIDAKVWNNADLVDSEVEEGDVVLITAEEDEFRGEPQLNIKVIQSTDDDSSQFLPSADSEEVDEKISEIKDFVEHIEDESIYRMVSDILNDSKYFHKSPASTYYHHAYIGGLAIHTYEVLMLALGTYAQFDLDYDKVVAGAVLHDIGKTLTYKWDKGFFEFTERGLNEDHIVGGYDICKQYKIHPDVLHIILSHHGKKEWGSPVEPNTPEAWAVHFSDLISSRMVQALA